MNLHPIDLTIFFAHLALIAMIGFIVNKRATRKVDSYFLTDCNVPWWRIGSAADPNHQPGKRTGQLRENSFLLRKSLSVIWTAATQSADLPASAVPTAMRYF